MTLENLVNIPGPLAEAFPQLDPATIQHADEIINDRRTLQNEKERQELRDELFWTADLHLYRVVKGEVVLYLARGKDNLIFKNLEEAVNQLMNNQNYIPDPKQANSVIRKKSTLKTKLSDLRLKEHSQEVFYLEIDTQDYDALNPAERALAERVYAQGEDFKENMKMLNDAGISKIRIYVLNPDYVKKKIPKGGSLARAGRLNYFGNNSNFDAIGRNLDFPDGVLLRGVRHEKIPQGDAAKKDQPELNYAAALDIVLNSPQELNPERALGLLNLTTEFYKKFL